MESEKMKTTVAAMKNKKYIILLIGVILLASTAVSFYFTSIDPMESTVKSVVSTLFNCPNKKILEAYEDSLKWKPGDEKVNYTGAAVDELYGSYFTGRALFELKRWPATEFTQISYRLGYTISVEKIDIEQDPENEYYYRFLAYLSYGGEGKPREYVEQDGTVLFDENQKIKHLWFSSNFVNKLQDLGRNA